MVQSRQDGIFSAGGLTGAGIPHDIHQRWITSDEVRFQYEAYLHGLTFKEFSPYLSQIGGQGMVFSLLDRWLPLSPQARLAALYAITSFLSAAPYP
jgi:hypothetical protein